MLETLTRMALSKRVDELEVVRDQLSVRVDEAERAADSLERALLEERERVADLEEALRFVRQHVPMDVEMEVFTQSVLGDQVESKGERHD